MKVNIKRLDTTALNAAMQKFVQDNDEFPTYLIMNEETRHTLIIEYESMNVTKTYGDWHKYAIYKGTPIAICEKLDFGEVDIV